MTSCGMCGILFQDLESLFHGGAGLAHGGVPLRHIEKPRVELARFRLVVHVDIKIDRKIQEQSRIVAAQRVGILEVIYRVGGIAFRKKIIHSELAPREIYQDHE